MVIGWRLPYNQQNVGPPFPSVARPVRRRADGLASLIFDAVLSIPAEQRKKPISVLCTDTRVEIPAMWL
jgi:hypothetical protein